MYLLEEESSGAYNKNQEKIEENFTPPMYTQA
jgi:hypothetical protein